MSLFKKLRAAPFILFYRLRGRPGRDYQGQWDSFWRSVGRTGTDGEVLWDTEDDTETRDAVERLRAHADFELPILDLGCGNGRRANWLAQDFARVFGVDVSQAAVALAQSLNSAIPFEVLDVTDAAAVQGFIERNGTMNVHVRGVLHLIQDKDLPAALANLRALLGDRGVLYFSETDGTALDYFLTKPGDSRSGLPKGMHKVIEHGIIPHGFGEDAHRRWFDDAVWETLSAGVTALITTRFADGEPGQVPAFYAVVRPRPAN